MFPAHQYVREQASTTPDGPGGGLDDIRRRIASAAAVMVGREVHALNAAIREQLSSTFKPWKRQEPGVKPRIRGWIVTPTGRCAHVTILVDDGASHCFVHSSLAREWGLERSGDPGPTGVMLAAGDVVHAIGEPAMVYMALGDTLREAISMSPLELEGGVDIILGWDWIVSHDLKKLYSLGEMVAEGPDGTVRVPMERRATLGGGQASAQAVGGLPGGGRLMGHSAFERLIGQPYAEEENATVAAVTGATKGGMWSRPLQAIGETAARDGGGGCRRAMRCGARCLTWGWPGWSTAQSYICSTCGQRTTSSHSRARITRPWRRCCSGTRASSTTPRRGYRPIVVSSYA